MAKNKKTLQFIDKSQSGKRSRRPNKSTNPLVWLKAQSKFHD